MLYVIATPIGNLEDISPRAIHHLATVSYVLCEDTRHSRRLMDRYSLSTQLRSYEKFSEASKLEPILRDLADGVDIALISDAGTPGISDPGERLIAACAEANLPVTMIPGPCALIQALVLSGLSTERFQFVGFLPRKPGQLKEILLDAFLYPGTTVAYESPNRLVESLKAIAFYAPERRIAVARELTKMFEEVVRGNATQLLARWEKEDPRGEIVIMIEGDKNAMSKAWQEMPAIDHVHLLEDTYEMARNDAIKLASSQRDIPKRALYDEVHEIT